MRYNLDDAFIQLGGTLAMQFTLTSAYTRYGCWGLTDDVGNPHRNYKFACLRDLLADTVVTSVSQPSSEDHSYEVSVYPNPSSGVVFLSYELLRSTDISLNIYDLFGQEVYRADIRRQGIGSHVLNWQAENEISGIYYYRLSFGNEFVSGSFVLKN